MKNKQFYISDYEKDLVDIENNIRQYYNISKETKNIPLKENDELLDNIVDTTTKILNLQYDFKTFQNIFDKFDELIDKSSIDHNLETCLILLTEIDLLIEANKIRKDE